MAKFKLKTPIPVNNRNGTISCLSFADSPEPHNTHKPQQTQKRNQEDKGVSLNSVKHRYSNMSHHNHRRAPSTFRQQLAVVLLFVAVSAFPLICSGSDEATAASDTSAVHSGHNNHHYQNHRRRHHHPRASEHHGVEHSEEVGGEYAGGGKKEHSYSIISF